MAELLTKKVPEDVVEYSVYPPLPEHLDKDSLNILLSDLLEVYLTELSPKILNYLWQKEPFVLHPIIETKDDCPPCLHGNSNYGDNIEDEWFIVYLLFELTKSCPGLVANIQDNDGEFLLIESAEVLPKWLDPETAKNRIFVYNGELHIIPIPENPAEMSNLPLFTPTIKDAIECVREYEKLTRASTEIQNAMKRKFQKYLDGSQQSLHYANCYIPANVASVLEQNPNLIAPAVEAFYYRDPIDLKVCRTMKCFPQEDMVMYRVKFTRFMYAQLLQQEFQPDRRSGWTLPSKSNSQFKSDDLGLKLAHGFEILCSRSSGKAKNKPADINNQDVRWQRYLQSLKNSGFFQNELEGSKQYQIFLHDAKMFYLDNLANQKGGKKLAGDLILDLLDSSEYSMEYFKQREKSLPPSDDDSWIEISPEELDNLLHETVGKQKTDAFKDTFDLSQISESMKTFVENVSTIDGAEFPKDNEEGDIKFDGMGFIHAMQKMFDFPEDKDDDSDDMDEYDWSEDDSDNDDDDFMTAKNFKLDRPRHKKDLKMQQYMAQMDRELDKTEMGKSFEKVPKSSQSKSQSSNKSGPKTAASSSKPKTKARNARDIDDEDDDFRPVDIDLTLVKNTLESYSAQQGLPGPATNILNSMGVRIPPNKDK